ncbi:MAG: hypothetical protein GXO74_13375 [Calditrichaeota bacterium]|nr:hypothetical protein [Calditrichota bacterium]
MKKISQIFILLIIVLIASFKLSAQIPVDSSLAARRNLIWQKSNQFRPAILLNGEWDSRRQDENVWHKTHIPGACAQQTEIFFRRSFSVDSALANCHFRLVCYGINNYCEIFVNNKFIGSHAGSYTSFYIDIPENFISVGRKNLIEIKVDTRLNNKNTLPLKYQFDGLRYDGGIIREIYLLALPRRSLSTDIEYSLNTDFSECTLNISLDVKDWQQRLVFSPIEQKRSPSLSYFIEIFDPLSGARIKRQFGKFSADEDLAFSRLTEKIVIKNPRLWSPEKPNRYRISVKLFNGRKVIDEFDTSLGFRQLDFFNGNIFLNGQQYFLRGINWAENYGESGIIFNFDEAVKRLLSVKRLNANAVRVPLFPPHPQIVGLCDSLGLFLLEEIPLKAVPSRLFSSEIFITRIRDYLTEAMDRDANHVSLFAVGVSSGYLSGDDEAQPFIEKIYPILSQPNHPYFYFTALPPQLKNPYLPGLIAGISLIRYNPYSIKNLLQKWLTQRLNAPTIVTDFGAPKYKFFDNDQDSVLYEKYQSAQIVQSYQTIRSFAEIDGCFITSLFDFKKNYASSLPGDFSDAYLRPFGLINSNNQSRFAFKTVKDLYTTGDAVYNPGITIFTGQVNFFIIAGLGLILIFLFVAHNRRYFRDNLKRSFVHPHGFYTDIRDGRKIPLSHTLLIALFSSASYGLILSSFSFFFKSNAIVDHLLTLIFFSPTMKEVVVRQIWRPEISFVILTVGMIFYFLLFAFAFRLVAFLFRKRTKLGRMIALSFWVGNIYIFLLPAGMIAYRLLAFSHLRIGLFALLAAFDLWYIFRAIRGLRVVFMMPGYKVAAIFFILTGLTLIALIHFLQIHSGFWDYLCYYLQIYRGYFHFHF